MLKGNHDYWWETASKLARSLHPSIGILNANSVIINRVAVAGTRVGNSHKHWLDCIDQGRQPPVCNASTARHITEVLLAGLRSGKEGRPVEVASRIRNDE